MQTYGRFGEPNSFILRAEIILFCLSQYKAASPNENFTYLIQGKGICLLVSETV